jgi:hypothetical protein
VDYCSVKHSCRSCGFLPLLAAIAATLWSGEAVEAGLVIAQQDQVSLSAEDSECEADFMSGASDQPVPEQNSLPHQIPGPRLAEAVSELAQSAGSTSSPSNAGTSGGGSIAAIARDLPPPALPSCSFEYLRECDVQLPQPPLGELLDPPRCFAA